MVHVELDFGKVAAVVGLKHELWDLLEPWQLLGVVVEVDTFPDREVLLLVGE